MNIAPEESTIPLRLVLFEGHGAEPLEASRRFEILQSLLASGYSVSCTGDEGSLAPPDEHDLLVLGEFGGDAPEAAGVATDGNVRVHVRDIDSLAPEGVVELVERFREDAGRAKPGSWKPWFPVIDYKRCTNCMQCLSFCLFDVYGVDTEQQITVQNPDKCKTNCPACSRVCPEVAILFPKYGSGPINGDEVQQDDVDREKMKVDISALLGGDIYSMLRDRHRKAESRFSKERDEGKALKERMRCLRKLQEEVDIPPEVLMALPSADEIRAKAQDAAERARRALASRNGDAPGTAEPAS